MNIRNFFAALALLSAAGCANYGAGLVPGQSTENDVEAAMGQPTAVKETRAGETILWYSKLPFGRETWAARIDRQGTLVSFDQRLTEENIARLKPDVMTEEDIMELFGPPYRQFKFPFKDRTSWEYPVRLGPTLQTLYIEFTPDHVVREFYRLDDQARPGALFGFGF